MNAFTLRLETKLSHQLEKICREQGYNKTGLIKSLIRKFIAEANGQVTRTHAPTKFNDVIGMVRLGGNAVSDADEVFT